VCVCVRENVFLSRPLFLILHRKSSFTQMNASRDAYSMSHVTLQSTRE